MNDIRNRLAAWLQMYDQSGMKPFSMGTMNGSQVYAPGATENSRMDWARQMLDRESQQPPDYFDFAQERQQAPPDRSVGPIRDVDALRASLQSAPMGQPQGLQRNRLLAMMGGNYGR